MEMYIKRERKANAFHLVVTFHRKYISDTMRVINVVGKLINI